jgi:hypothetical protein
MATKKKCPRCKGIFTLAVFGTRVKGGKVRREVYCPPCSRAYRREHYHANSAAYKLRARRSQAAAKKRNRVVLLEYLQTHPCVDCGNGDFRVLQFDHVRGKKLYGVGCMTGHNTEALLREMAKCDVRCANCHVIATGRRRKCWWTRLK